MRIEVAKTRKSQPGIKSRATPKKTRAKTADGTATVTRKITKKGAKTKVKWARNRQPKPESDTITNSDTHKRLTEAILSDKPKRPYRHRDEMPDPTKPRWHKENRLDAHFQTRLDPDLADLVDAFRESSGMTKREITERALKEFLEKHNFNKS